MHAVCSVWFAVCHLLFAVCRWSLVACGLWFVVAKRRLTEGHGDDDENSAKVVLA